MNPTPFSIPQGRLSLTTALSVTTADVTAATTIYYTPHNGEQVPMRGSLRTVMQTFAEASLALDSNSGHTGYHQSGKLFDVFGIMRAGVFDIGTGPAWTSAVARADAITRKDGVYVNNAAIVIRFGSGASDTVSVPAYQALYLGTFYASADGQTEDSFANRLVWNAYNRIERGVRVFDATDTWAGSAAASWRQARNNTANQVAMVRGLNEDLVTADVRALALGSGATLREIYAGIGLDAVNAIATGCLPGLATASSAGKTPLNATYRGLPGLGYHYLSWLEYDHASDTRTYYGDNGAATTIQTGIHGVVKA